MTRFPLFVQRLICDRFGRYQVLRLVRFRAGEGRELLATTGAGGPRVYRDAGRLADPVPVEVADADLTAARTALAAIAA